VTLKHLAQIMAVSPEVMTLKPLLLHGKTPTYELGLKGGIAAGPARRQAFLASLKTHDPRASPSLSPSPVCGYSPSLLFLL